MGNRNVNPTNTTRAHINPIKVIIFAGILFSNLATGNNNFSEYFLTPSSIEITYFDVEKEIYIIF